MGVFDYHKNSTKGMLVSWRDDDPKADEKLKLMLSDFLSGKSKSVVFNLDQIDQKIATQIIENASSGRLDGLEDFVIEVVANTNCSQIAGTQIEIQSNNLQFTPIYSIGVNHIGKIIRVHGLVNRTSIIHPMYINAVFRCSECNQPSQPIYQERPWSITKPYGRCKANNCVGSLWEPIPEMSEMVDSQEFMLQESYDDISSNRISRTIHCLIFKKSLMNYVNCGDDVDVICIVKAMPELRKSRSKFTTTYLEVIGISKRRKDPESITFSEEEEEAIRALSKNPNAYAEMIESLAPSLYGHEIEKEAVLLAIFGSPEEKREDITIRGNIHILMVGDPATAKSQLLRAAVELSPRGMYAMGRGTTAAGLTAALVKSNSTDEWEISAGVLVLADEGIAAIDEIDKMREEDRVNIHEAMEQQCVSIDKAGVHAQLRARTAVIAAANPLSGRYDPYKSVFENLPKFPPSLYSRFDLIFKVVDIPNSEYDSKVISHIIDNASKTSPIDRAFLRKYIAFSKRIKPELSEEASEILKKYFLSVRETYKDDQKKFPFSYRQFEALKRLTLARARSLLKEKADVTDVEAVKRLFNVFLDETCEGNVTQIETGMSSSQTRLIQIILDALRKTPMSEEALRSSINLSVVENEKFRKILTKMQNDGLIYAQEFSLDGKPIYRAV